MPARAIARAIRNVNNPSNESVYPADEWHPNIYQWGRTGANAGKVIPASNPLDFDGGGAPVGVGPAMSFAKGLLARNPRQRILIIPAAVGATGFSSHHWNPGDKVYEQMVAMVNAALTFGGSLKGMVWNQGEGDTTLSAREYAAGWTAMFNDFRARVKGGWPDDAVVLFGDLANPNFARRTDQIADGRLISIPHFAIVKKEKAGVDQLPDAEKYDDASKVHFSAKAQRLMGAAYAEAIPAAQASRP